MTGEFVGTTRRGTVLIVDDDEAVRLSLRAILEDTCEVLEAADGEGALRILRDRAVDIVTLDQQMPGSSGLDVLPRIKALDPSIAVAVITGVRDAQKAVEAIRLGALDYVVKPFDVDTILRLVRSAFETRALDRHGAANPTVDRPVIL
jgi:DNA-binding NtrC family response regulator